MKTRTLSELKAVFTIAHGKSEDKSNKQLALYKLLSERLISAAEATLLTDYIMDPEEEVKESVIYTIYEEHVDLETAYETIKSYEDEEMAEAAMEVLRKVDSLKSYCIAEECLVEGKDSLRDRQIEEYINEALEAVYGVDLKEVREDIVEKIKVGYSIEDLKKSIYTVRKVPHKKIVGN